MRRINANLQMLAEMHVGFKCPGCKCVHHALAGQTVDMVTIADEEF